MSCRFLLNYRFLLEDVQGNIITCFDHQLNRRWIILITLWWDINSTNLDDAKNSIGEKNADITERLLENSLQKI